MFECGYFMAQVDNGDLENEDIPLDGCSKQERVIPRPHVEIEKEKKPSCVAAPVKGLAFSGCAI